MAIDGCKGFFTDYFLMKNICLNSACVTPMTTGVNKKQVRIGRSNLRREFQAWVREFRGSMGKKIGVVRG